MDFIDKGTDEEECESSHKFFLDGFENNTAQISKLGLSVPLMLEIDTQMYTTWLNLHLQHKPLNKIKPLMGK